MINLQLLKKVNAQHVCCAFLDKYAPFYTEMMHWQSLSIGNDLPPVVVPAIVLVLVLVLWSWWWWW